jgi:rhomboid protease GluP
MTTISAAGSRVFNVRFAPSATLMRPVSSAQSNQFNLVGKGTFEIAGTEILLHGKRKRPFWFGAKLSISIPVATAVNVERQHKKITFRYQLATGMPGIISIWAISKDEAAAIVSALPATMTEEFAQRKASESDFKCRLTKLSPTAYVTPTLVAINVLVFLFTVCRGADIMNPDGGLMILLGSDYGPMTTTGEWWRVVTSMFLHFGVLHIAFNMWALWSTGKLVERLYGSCHFLLLYMLAGICGSVASITWNPLVNSAGASGAIFGVFGALLAYVVDKKSGVPASIMRQHQSSTLGFIAINLFNGFVHAGIDNAAHIGGLAGGFVFGWMLSRPLTEEARTESNAPRLFVALIIGVGILASVVATPYLRGPDFINDQLFRRGLFQYSLEEDGYLQALKERPMWKNESENIRRIETELLPYWDRMRAALGAPKLSERSSLFTLQRDLTDYIESRRKGFAKYIEADRAHDPIAMREAEQLIKKSDEALQQQKD